MHILAGLHLPWACKDLFVVQAASALSPPQLELSSSCSAVQVLRDWGGQLHLAPSEDFMCQCVITQLPAHILRDVLAACPFDGYFDSPELQESCSWKSCQGLAARIWASSAPIASPPTAVFLQLGSGEQMQGIRDQGFPPALLSQESSWIWQHLQPEMCCHTFSYCWCCSSPAGSCPVPQHWALFSLLPAAPSQLATLLQGSLSGLAEVPHCQMGLVAKWLPD